MSLATPLTFERADVIVALLEFDDFDEFGGVAAQATMVPGSGRWQVWCRHCELGAVLEGSVDLLLLPPGETPMAAFERLSRQAYSLLGGVVPSVYLGPPIDTGSAYPTGSPVAAYGGGVLFGHPNLVEFTKVASDARGVLVGEWEALDDAAAVRRGDWRRLLRDGERLVAEHR